MALDLTKPLQEQLLDANGPVCLIVTARLVPVGDTDRFQPAGFPEVGHVIYDAPRIAADGRKYKEKVCIVDSPASMANHLEKVCLAGEGTIDLHPDLAGLPFVRCVTDSEFETKDGAIVPKADSTKDSVVASTFSEGHRLASDYFLDARKLSNGEPEAESLREQLRKDFKIIEVKKDKTYFIPPETWWNIYTTIFNLDPNSLVHGVMFAKEQIKISRLLTAHLEAFGAARVGRTGVKFDRLQKTTSGQPIFSVDEETAEEIRATFILDLGLLRSYGRGKDGLNSEQKRLLLELAIWKIEQLVKRPFRYRTQCFLQCESVTVSTEDGLVPASSTANTETADTNPDDKAVIKDAAAKAVAASQQLARNLFASLNLKTSIESCKFPAAQADVYYPANELFKPGKETEAVSDDQDEEEDNG
ncbi:MAG: hypothetical protein J5I93_05770 [Pirellulaceae bacterium]|nr:hypothetical protein [Pirellulaceae bacterium]